MQEMFIQRMWKGIHVHKYGAHIFHTNNTEVWELCIPDLQTFNRFTNSVRLQTIIGELYSLPFNMYTFNKMWGVVTPEEAAAKIEEQRREAGITGEPKNLEEQAISLVGRDIFEKLCERVTQRNSGGVTAKSCRHSSSGGCRFGLLLTITISTHLYQGIPIRWLHQNW